MVRITFLSLLLAARVLAADPAPLGTPPAGGPELRDGDMVALIGNGFIEREAHYGYIETALTARYADRNIRFRNLGWSGDTVWCESRAYFGTPEDGFKHLVEHVDLVKPTVIILNYGGNEAFAGEAGLPKFVEGYNRLLNELEKRTKRIILLSPTPVLGDPDPLIREKYVSAIAELASRRAFAFINIYDRISRWPVRDEPYSSDCVYPNEFGYAITSGDINEAFRGGAQPLWMDFKELEPLRRAIVEKNILFFHRHRPENETYLRGFRKHEQGNNAVEIFAFEPLVAEKEKEIARLRGELLKALQSKDGGK